MNKRVKKKWLKALRSGEYIQGDDQLCQPHWIETEDGRDEKSGDFAFCCLGVLENLYHEEKGTSFTERAQRASYHCDAVAEWADLSNVEYDDDSTSKEKKYKVRDGWCGATYGRAFEKLAHMNDQGKSFAVIANWIERYL